VNAPNAESVRLPEVFIQDPPAFKRGSSPFPETFAPRNLFGRWTSTRGAPSGLTVICSDAIHDGDWWRHVSVSRPDRLPSWNDVKAVKQAFIGDRYAFMVFPDKAHYVSIHDNCLHLFATHDGDNGNVLPEFTEGSGSV
jgi:hypothetical protein